jgi:hypothetical protein
VKRPPPLRVGSKLNLPRRPRTARFPPAELLDAIPQRDKLDVIESYLLCLAGFDRESHTLTMPLTLGLEIARLMQPLRGRKRKFASELAELQFWVRMVEHRKEKLLEQKRMSKGQAAAQAAMEIAPLAKADMGYRGKTETLVNELLDGLGRADRLPKRRRAKTPNRPG